jgi:nitroreductase
MESERMSEIGLFEAMYTTSGVVDVKPDPIEKEVIERLLDAAIRAPSGSNTQPWGFVVVRDPDVKARIKECVLEGAKVHLSVMNALHVKPQSGKVGKMARKFASQTDKCPALIFVCLDNMKVRGQAKITLSAALGILRNPGFLRFARLASYASIFPCVQNLILAARGLGLATRLSMWPFVSRGKVESILGIPKHVEPVAMIYLGYAAEPFVRTKRLPAEQCTHYDRW